MSNTVSDDEIKVSTATGSENMASAFKSTYRKMVISATILISTLMIIGFAVSYASQNIADIINTIAYIAITPIFTAIGLYILNKKLLYRETIKGVFVKRYKGRLAAMDSIPELVLTTFFSMVLPFALIFLPPILMFNNTAATIVITCLKCSIALFASLKLFQVMITRESTPAQKTQYNVNRIPYPNEYSASDVRNTTSPISPGSPQYQNYLANQYYKKVNNIK